MQILLELSPENTVKTGVYMYTKKGVAIAYTLKTLPHGVNFEVYAVTSWVYSSTVANGCKYRCNYWYKNYLFVV